MRKKFFFLCFFACGALLPLLPAGAADAQQAYAPVSPQTFTLQIMTLLDKYSADTELQKLRKLGYSAYVSEYTTESGKVIYKIRCGKYANRSSAVAAAKEYQANEGVAVMVVTASDNTPAGKARPAQNAAVPDMAEEKKDDGGKNVRITVQDAEKTSVPASLQDKVAALKRGEMPVQDKKTAAQGPDDGIWFTLQTSTEPDKQSAERRINQLGRKGYDAYCVETPLNNGKTQYKIRIGKYESPEEAGQAAQKYTTRESRGCLVVKITSTSSSESEQTDSGRIAAAGGQQQDEPDHIDAEPLPQAAQSEIQKTLPPADTEHIPSSEELPSEPEPAQPASMPAKTASFPEDIDQKERTGSDSEQMEASDAAVEDTEPQRMIKIYAYRTESGSINLTNKYENIPASGLNNIEYVSLFPVYLKELAKEGSRLTIEADGQKTDIILAGFILPKDSKPARAYLDELKTKPLRLKYSPNQRTKDGAIAGRLFLKEGSYINLDMVRKGLGECSVQMIASDQQEAFRQAQEAAKREKVGIWAN
ncbi:MAG: SPOR domain-containing protein [Deltaproteobacteria bacterium]|nr:SPOR domain-containing protein [Deltaproteobacteria bacterium]